MENPPHQMSNGVQNGVAIKLPSEFLHSNGYHHHHQENAKPLLPEYWKTLISCLYLNFVSLSMCYVVIVAHQERPDRHTHPPLPDLMDHLPFGAWGTQGTELCTMILSMTFLPLVIAHKHRTIMIRRFCIIMATIYAMRIITVLSTALPVLPPPSECSTIELDTPAKRLKIALVVWMKSGSRLSGIKMCGDYMFSGHVTSLTVLNLFIIEYSPGRLFPIRLLSTAINITGSVLMVIGRGHYTVDVVIAIILVFVVFHYYHSQASIYVLTKSSEKLRWFPFFYYFERNVCRKVPNEYEIPRILDALRSITSKIMGKRQQ